MTISEYRAILSRKGKCPTCGRGGKSKFGAVAVTDPETGTRIPSKHEMKVLARKRLEADAQGWITALHPRFKVEGGRYEADVVEIELMGYKAPNAPRNADGWDQAWVRFTDAKGRDHPRGRKSRKQVEVRYGLVVQIVKE